MSEILLILVLVLLLVTLFLVFIIFRRADNQDASKLTTSIESFAKSLDRLETILKDEFSRSRDDMNKNSRDIREEIGSIFKNFDESIKSTLVNIANFQKNQLDTFSGQLNVLTQANSEKLDKMAKSIEDKLRYIQEDNNKQLEEMRHIVDEKLHATLEKRLGESFRLVSERLEQVHKGLGEMQTLATGVGDLKKVLSNVKAKGILGEYQLGGLLEQFLAPEQYGKDVKVNPGKNQVVEYALKLPGREDSDKPVWLAIDSKFPTEDYQALLSAYEQGNPALIDEAGKYLSAKIKLFAKDIKEKYIEPPFTTDFGIMFLPFEGLYAEVLRIPGLFETIQREFKVTITGPTTLAAFMNALQIGFRTLAIQKRSGEVWELLRAVKSEFGIFGDILEKTKKKLQETSNVIDQASVRSRAIERKLRDVQVLPQAENEKLIDSAELTIDDEQ